jgi:hypothetical protein
MIIVITSVALDKTNTVIFGYGKLPVGPALLLLFDDL